MFRLQYKVSNALQSWSNYGSYGSESSALNVAVRINARYFAVRIIDSVGRVVYFG